MSIEGIYICKKGGMPMEAREEASLITKRGIDGDRYCSLTGTYSVLQTKEGVREPARQLTIISADDVEGKLLGEQVVEMGNLRRNLVVRGLAAPLRDAIGHVVQIGSTTRVLAHRLTVPCMYNERLNKCPKLMETLWYDAGISCEVLEGGTIRVGDAISILFDETRPTYPVSEAYLTPPSKRTAQMVKDGLQGKREMKERLLKIDPEGVQRADESYAQVDLKFWPK
jgi:MOSC domain-containing protein YiiM